MWRNWPIALSAVVLSLTAWWLWNHLVLSAACPPALATEHLVAYVSMPGQTLVVTERDVRNSPAIGRHLLVPLPPIVHFPEPPALRPAP